MAQPPEDAIDPVAAAKKNLEQAIFDLNEFQNAVLNILAELKNDTNHKYKVAKQQDQDPILQLSHNKDDKAQEELLKTTIHKMLKKFLDNVDQIKLQFDPKNLANPSEKWLTKATTLIKQAKQELDQDEAKINTIANNPTPAANANISSAQSGMLIKIADGLKSFFKLASQTLFNLFKSVTAFFAPDSAKENLKTAMHAETKEFDFQNQKKPTIAVQFGKQLEQTAALRKEIFAAFDNLKPKNKH